jgi:hypothetical protein
MSRVSENLYDAAIADLVDALDGVAFGASSTLTTSATPTVDQLEANDGVIAGKINTILAALRAAGVIKES